MVERQQPEVAAVQRDLVRVARRRHPAGRGDEDHRWAWWAMVRATTTSSTRRHGRPPITSPRPGRSTPSWPTTRGRPRRSLPRIRRSEQPRCCATCLLIEASRLATHRSGSRRGAATIAEVQSQPLPAILAEMLTTSDNNTAEMVLKEIGFKAKGQGTREAGLQVVMETFGGVGHTDHRCGAGRWIRPLRREPGDVRGHPRSPRTRLADRRRRAGHARRRGGRWNARRRLHQHSVGRQAARQDRLTQPQLQPRPARREVARRLPARSRRRSRSSSSSSRTANASPTTTNRCGINSAKRWPRTPAVPAAETLAPR